MSSVVVYHPRVFATVLMLAFSPEAISRSRGMFKLLFYFSSRQRIATHCDSPVIPETIHASLHAKRNRHPKPENSFPLVSAQMHSAVSALY